MTEKNKETEKKPEDYSTDDCKNSRWYSAIGEKGDRKLAKMLNDMMDEGRIKTGK